MAISRMRFKANNNGTYYIDLAKALSLQERKLHRQKNIYTVYGGFFVDGQGQRIDINVAPNTWVTRRAVNRGFAMWRKMTAKTLQDAGASSKSKYRDFKVFLNTSHGVQPMLPVDADGNNLYTSSGPEWDYSTLTTEDPAEDPGTGTKLPADSYELMIVGKHQGADPDWTRISLVQSWVDSRPSPEADQPNNIPVVTDPLMNLFDDGDVQDDRLTIINSEGDAAPYDELTMFGNAQTNAASHNLQRVSVARPTANTQLVAPVHGFQALCGLIELRVGSDTAANEWELVLDVETKGESF